jgi:hypothetical protein
MITNSASHFRPYRFLAAALVASLGLVLSQTASGQSAASVATPPGISATGTPATSGGSVSTPAAHDQAARSSIATAKMENSKGASGAINQGIKMHGHWVIDVKNPDGTIVQHRDFENSLEAGAPQFLIGLMSGYFVPGDYAIELQAETGSSPCSSSLQPGCVIVRSLTTNPGIVYCESYGYYCGTGLTYTYNLAGTGPYSMVLAGSITANQAGTIGQVNTAYNSCANIAFTSINAPPTTVETSSPASCVANTTTNWEGPLSSATITSVPVASGQIIQVTVTITFS